MGALAVATERIRLGQMCTCNSYRPPAYLAKVAASIDVISGGRVEMGIGGGWYEQEYLGYGYEFPPPAVRLGQLAEGVEIMRRMWTEDEVHYQGKHYQLKGAICQPKPVQQPHIPLWVAGGGEQLTLRIAAKHAAYTNFGDNLEEFNMKSKILAEHCRQVGTDFDSITRSAIFRIVIGETEAEVAARLDQVRSYYSKWVSGDALDRQLSFYGKASGTPEQMIETFKQWQTAGMTYAICYFFNVAMDRSGLDLFTRTVMPALSAS
jgi:alkanesulfonate monooxygenase SsuD/methylene tetrahydromethanopterin reductase-like flavin-dependent oxidoreductase (luciferase family)